MLRKALKRPVQTTPNLGTTQTKQGPSLGHYQRPKTSYDEQLEGIVFGGGDNVIEKLECDAMQKIHKTKKKKRHIADDIESDRKPAWIDAHDTIAKSKNMATPSWAKMEKDEDKDVDSDLEDLLQRAGDILVKSSSLPAGMIQIKRLADANVDDKTVGRLQNVEFHPTAKVILTAGTSNRLNLFQIDGKNNPKIQSIFFEDFPIHTAHFSPSGEEVIVGSDRKNFMYYDMIGGKVVSIPRIKAMGGTNMARFEVSPDGRCLLFLGRYGAMHVVDARSKEYVATLTMNGDVRSVAFSEDGSKMYSFGNGTVFVWDMTTRSCVHTFVDEGCVQGTCVAVSPNNQHLVCGSQSGIVNIYDANACLQSTMPKPLKSIMNLTTVCNKAKFNGFSEILALSSNEMVKGVKLIQFPSMHSFANFPEMTDTDMKLPKCLDFSPNGGYMAIGNHKGRALLYRLKHYREY